jgi:hypothetical protein
MLEVGLIADMDDKGAQQVADWLHDNKEEKISRIKMGQYFGNKYALLICSQLLFSYHCFISVFHFLSIHSLRAK